MTTFSRLSYRCNYCGVRRRCAAFYNARAHLSSARKHGQKTATLQSETQFQAKLVYLNCHRNYDCFVQPACIYV